MKHSKRGNWMTYVIQTFPYALQKWCVPIFHLKLQSWIFISENQGLLSANVSSINYSNWAQQLRLVWAADVCWKQSLLRIEYSHVNYPIKVASILVYHYLWRYGQNSPVKPILFLTNFVCWKVTNKPSFNRMILQIQVLKIRNSWSTVGTHSKSHTNTSNEELDHCICKCDIQIWCHPMSAKGAHILF